MAKRQATRNTNQPELTFPAKTLAKKPGRSPEDAARLAVARMPTTISGHRVKVTPTLFLPRGMSEYLSARAIREEKSTPGVIAEILSAESRRA